MMSSISTSGPNLKVESPRRSFSLVGPSRHASLMYATIPPAEVASSIPQDAAQESSCIETNIISNDPGDNAPQERNDLRTSLLENEEIKNDGVSSENNIICSVDPCGNEQNDSKKRSANFSVSAPSAVAELATSRKRHKLSIPLDSTPCVLQRLIDQLTIQQAQLLDIQDALIDLRTQLDSRSSTGTSPPLNACISKMAPIGVFKRNFEPNNKNQKKKTSIDSRGHLSSQSSLDEMVESRVEDDKQHFVQEGERVPSKTGLQESTVALPPAHESIRWAEILSALQNFSGASELGCDGSEFPTSALSDSMPCRNFDVIPVGKMMRATMLSKHAAPSADVGMEGQIANDTNTNIDVQPASSLHAQGYNLPATGSQWNGEGLPPGVWYDRVENRYVVQCNQTTACGRKKRRYFGVSRYGEEGARRCAIHERLKIMGVLSGPSSTASPQSETSGLSTAESNIESEIIDAMSQNQSRPYQGEPVRFSQQLCTNIDHSKLMKLEPLKIDPVQHQAGASPPTLPSIVRGMTMSPSHVTHHLPIVVPPSRSQHTGDVRSSLSQQKSTAAQKQIHQVLTQCPQQCFATGDLQKSPHFQKEEILSSELEKLASAHPQKSVATVSSLSAVASADTAEKNSQLSGQTALITAAGSKTTATPDINVINILNTILAFFVLNNISAEDLLTCLHDVKSSSPIPQNFDLSSELLPLIQVSAHDEVKAWLATQFSTGKD